MIRNFIAFDGILVRNPTIALKLGLEDKYQEDTTASGKKVYARVGEPENLIESLKWGFMIQEDYAYLEQLVKNGETFVEIYEVSGVKTIEFKAKLKKITKNIGYYKNGMYVFSNVELTLEDTRWK